MTRMTFEAALDCTSKIKGLVPPEEKIREMLSFLSKVDRLSEICRWEGPSGIKLEAASLPEETAYEKAFKESIRLWIDGAGINAASDHAANRYFEENPSGYDAAIFFAAVFGVGNILKGEHAYGFIDEVLQYLLPDGWRWREEDDRESDEHKDDDDRVPWLHSHRKAFLGDPMEAIQHRFDDVKVCNLITEKDDGIIKIGRRIADMLPGYNDGALQLIMAKLTYHDLEKALYALPEEAEELIMANINPYSIPVIKGNCIMNKDSVSSFDITASLKMFEDAINAYDGDPALEAGYDDL